MEVLSGLRVARVFVTLPWCSTRIGAHLAGGESVVVRVDVAASASLATLVSLRRAASSAISRSVGNIDLGAGGLDTIGSGLGTAAMASSIAIPAPDSRLRIAMASLSGTPISMASFSENVARSSGRRYLLTLSTSVTAAIVSTSSARPTSSQHRLMNSASEPCDCDAPRDDAAAPGGNVGGADAEFARSTPSAVERHRGVEARDDAFEARLAMFRRSRRISIISPVARAPVVCRAQLGERVIFLTPRLVPGFRERSRRGQDERAGADLFFGTFQKFGNRGSATLSRDDDERGESVRRRSPLFVFSARSIRVKHPARSSRVAPRAIAAPDLDLAYRSRVD